MTKQKSTWNISPRYNDAILQMLDTMPLPEVRERTRLSFLTLGKIAHANRRDA